MKDLKVVKQRMKDYRDIFGGELNNSHLIDTAETISDLEAILSSHYDYINDIASDAQSSLNKFKTDLGVF